MPGAGDPRQTPIYVIEIMEIIAGGLDGVVEVCERSAQICIIN